MQQLNYNYEVSINYNYEVSITISFVNRQDN